MSKQKFSRSKGEEQRKAVGRTVDADLSIAASAARFGVWSLDLNTQVVHWSQSMVELAPEIFRDQEPSLDLYLSAVHSDDRASVTQALEKCIRENRPFKVRHRFINGDQTIWIEGSGQILQDTSGPTLRIVGSCQDISERVQVEIENELLMSSLGVGIWKFFPKENRLTWDKSMFMLYGISEASFSGHVDAWENSLTPETRERAIAELKEGLNGKKDFYTTFDIRTPSGDLKSIFAAAKVLRNSEGEPIAMYGINRDISAEVEHLKDIDRTEKRFRSIFEVSPTPKLVFGKTGILDCNPAAVKILRASSKADLLSRHPAEFSPEIQPDGRRSDEKSIEMDRLAHENGVHRFDWVHKNLNGVEFPVDVTLAPVNWDGEEALLVLWSDQTEKKAQELKILKTSKLASLGQLSAGIAHEINNPLAIVEGTARLLPKYIGDPQKLTSKIEAIERACGRIAKIVNGLKKFSRSDDKRDHEPRSLSQIVKEVVFLTDLKSKRHATPVAVDCTTDDIILCDEVEIEQVVVNLINNAIDAVKDKSAKWVKVSVFEDQSGVKFRVTDSGSGISEATKQRLFEPFFTTKKVGEGTGLGLSISKGILDEHGATIRVVDGVSNTCFEITFPKIKEHRHVA